MQCLSQQLDAIQLLLKIRFLKFRNACVKTSRSAVISTRISLFKCPSLLIWRLMFKVTDICLLFPHHMLELSLTFLLTRVENKLQWFWEMLQIEFQLTVNLMLVLMIRYLVQDRTLTWCSNSLYLRMRSPLQLSLMQILSYMANQFLSF
jgi:hypothetical protein